ncbi:AMP-binding protein [Sciscionella marina]|uniref:AMP-binding protein n=1 Tax=Sciscionella marina TaxID=508770 RepID=UPI0003807062|nr:AMP-binding protein [Sciscionella marina]
MARNVADLVRSAAARVPDGTALLDQRTDRMLTWAGLDAEVDRLARGYLGAGLEPGDRVVLSAPTSVETCLAVFGVLRAGGIVVPMAPDSPARVIEAVIADAGARFGIGVSGVPELTPGDPADTLPETGDEDIAVLCFTSGTAAGPNGVRLSHRALLANVEQCARIEPAPVTAQDTLLLCLPLHHIYGLSAALFQVAAAGASAVLLDGFHPDEVLDVLGTRQVTSLIGVPPMYAALLERGSERLAKACAQVRLLTSGAAPLPEAVLTGIREATGLEVHEGYGLTEAGPVVTWSLVSGATKPGSVGRPIPGVELRLVDNDGSELPEPDESGDDNDEGRIAIRGDNLFSGYWPDGERGPDAEGWFVTGDVGYLDTEGDLHLIDREGDLIIVNGFNVFPHEVEEVLDALPGVREAAVIGVPDERTGEAVKAVLVLAGELTEEEIRAHCTARLARFKVPSVIEFADTLPHSPTGKLFRRTLRA